MRVQDLCHLTVTVVMAGRWHCGESGWDSEALSAPVKRDIQLQRIPWVQEITGWPGWGAKTKQVKEGLPSGGGPCTVS